MTRLLLMEGNPAALRERAIARGLRMLSGIYAEAIHAHFPDIEIDVVYTADPDPTFPEGRNFADYDGFVASGSSLHAYDEEPAVTAQIDMLKAAAEAGLPILGSCWGLQIAAVAAGGEVRYNPKGREVGISRKIAANGAGRSHPMLAGRGAVFDAPCIHYDEVMRLPEDATLLASNEHSAIQAAVIPLGNSEVWAVQYHPEFDLAHMAALYGLYADDMIAQGFFADQVQLDDYRAKIEALVANPDDSALRWQLGIDDDILDDRRRRAEIIAWVETKILA